MSGTAQSNENGASLPNATAFAAMPGSPNFPGYCITMFEGSVWLTKEGKITPDYEERGVWMTLPEAEAALEAANSGNGEICAPAEGKRDA